MRQLHVMLPTGSQAPGSHTTGFRAGGNPDLHGAAALGDPRSE